MSRLVLGLNTDHGDTSAVLVGEQGAIAAIAEERINRQKHSSRFPKNAIAEVLRIAGAEISDVTDIAVARDPRANVQQKVAYALTRKPGNAFRLINQRLRVHNRVRSMSERIAGEIGVDHERIGAQVHAVEHHLAHIASAYFWSPFESCAGFSVDGTGDFASTMWAECDGNDIQILRRTHWPHSLGVYYTGICQFIGFDKYGEEYKVMGLSAYGQNRYSALMRDIVSFHPDKGLRLNLSYFQHHDRTYQFESFDDGRVNLPRLWGDRLIAKLGPPRQWGTEITDRERDLSASMQIRHEEVFLDMVNALVGQTGHRRLVLAGGSVLNSVANGRMLTEGYVDKAYFQPAASDDGTAMGAALYVMHSVHDQPRTDAVNHAYWGTQWSPDEIELALKENGRPYERLNYEALLDRAAGAMKNGKIMGWFQGREEWGPRALGNRSILCNPAWPDMKAILNARIKNREPFRPFAPVIREEDLGLCFEGSHPVPFMIAVYKVRPEWREKLPAITHEDDTGRVQTVRREDNPTYYDLITRFKEVSGVPVLLNTSFNENEPIVHTPAQAVACFERTKMDALGIGAFWLEKD